jgi:outer membrane receptor protein involved in Fe transport
MAHAGGGLVRFLVVDPESGKPVPGYVLLVEGGKRWEMPTIASDPGETAVVDPSLMSLAKSGAAVTTIRVPLGGTVTLQQKRPVKTFTITVTATRIRPNASPIQAAGATISSAQNKELRGQAQNVQQIVVGQPGVAEDSAGQIHVRGEHTDISYVVDGVPLPDTLSGRAGSIVVPSTIQNLDVITGAFAPEFGGQTAAVFSITSLPSVKQAERDLTIQGGSYNSLNGDLTAVGTFGSKLNYVLDINGTTTDLLTEPTQPDHQDAHNHGTAESVFAKLRYEASKRDSLTLSMSDSPDKSQISNRTGLPASFAAAGEGYGFGGLRNADGTIPTANGLLGSQTIVLKSQEADGMDINQTEANEFATLNYVHKISDRDTAQAAFTILHSGQDVTNNNPLVDVLNLPVDNSIEYNPTASRNIHQLEGIANLTMKRGHHTLKAGLLYDSESGNESYQIQPASQLALDALAGLDPALAPAGTSSSTLDVNGYHVYTPTSSVTPTQSVHRVGTYQAIFIQDTWQVGRFDANYGLRYDRFLENQDDGQQGVDSDQLSPRLNFDYKLDSLTQLRWSYDHLYNTPPIAQGATVGQAIQPEIVDQYDLGITHKIRPNQTVSLAYYVKSIKDQVDVGLLIPGSQIGLYSAVNFQRGEVHGVEFSYELTPPKGTGWDTFLNISYSAAKPNGLDNTGVPVPDYNDHDQRETVGSGLAYSWKSGASAATTFDYGSGLASSTIPPSTARHPRHEFGLHLNTGDRVFAGRGGFSLDIDNLFDNRQVINFQSAFSGTRFQQARRILLSTHYKF